MTIKKNIKCLHCKKEFYTPYFSFTHAFSRHKNIMTNKEWAKIAGKVIYATFRILFFILPLQIIKWFCFPCYWLYEKIEDIRW